MSTGHQPKCPPGGTLPPGWTPNPGGTGVSPPAPTDQALAERVLALERRVAALERDRSLAAAAYPGLPVVGSGPETRDLWTILARLLGIETR